MPIFACMRGFHRIFEKFSLGVIQHPGEQGFDIEMVNFGGFVLFPFTRRRDLLGFEFRKKNQTQLLLIQEKRRKKEKKNIQ